MSVDDSVLKAASSALNLRSVGKVGFSQCVEVSRLVSGWVSLDQSVGGAV